MQRIVVIGATGSGKTTLATRLAAQHNLKLIDLDDLYLRPDWKEAPTEEFRAAVRHAINENPRWITAGNYRAIYDITWTSADTLIWLDYSFPRVLLQLLRRTCYRIRTKTPVCNGNYESLGKVLFSRHSIILWLLRSYMPKKKEYQSIFATPENYPNIRHFIRLKSPKQAHFIV